MIKTLWIAVRILLLVSFVALAFGAVVPSDRASTPYLSALSNVAVGTAAAVGCPNQVCFEGTCSEVAQGFKCTIQPNGHCKTVHCV